LRLGVKFPGPTRHLRPSRHADHDGRSASGSGRPQCVFVWCPSKRSARRRRLGLEEPKPFRFAFDDLGVDAADHDLPSRMQQSSSAQIFGFPPAIKACAEVAEVARQEMQRLLQLVPWMPDCHDTEWLGMLVTEMNRSIANVVAEAQGRRPVHRDWETLDVVSIQPYLTTWSSEQASRAKSPSPERPAPLRDPRPERPAAEDEPRPQFAFPVRGEGHDIDAPSVGPILRQSERHGLRVVPSPSSLQMHQKECR
jgi:hypothetical protein